MKLISLRANFPEFHSVELHDGMNIIVADRTKEATRTDSRNGLGKTTVIALIDFCLGANMSDRLEQMLGRDWLFTLALSTKSGATLQVTRGPDRSGDIRVEGDLVLAGLATVDQASEHTYVVLSQRAWTNWLADQAFVRKGMPTKPPTFRSLMRHLARYRADSLIDPFRTVANQRAEATQAENAYLFNLDWRFAKEWADLKERKSRLALADDPELSIESRIAALEPQLIRLQRRADRLKEQLEQFSILPQYRELETRINRTSAAIKAMANENVTDKQQLAIYESQAGEEFSSGNIEVERLFAEAGVVLGDAVVRRLDEAAAFQRQVVENRAAYLAEESRRIRNRIQAREAEQVALASQNEADLQLLRSGGALDDFAVLQQKLAAAQTEVAQIADQIQTLRQLGERKSRLKSDELDLVSRTNLDLQERLHRRAPIIARFGEIMETLIGEAADLRVSLGKGGLQFKTTLPRSGSAGVHLMAIFAYDIAIVEDLARDGRGPGFLLHDSTIFADVDERQIAQAIEIASASAAEFDYQYVLTMNSDKVPWSEFSKESVFAEAVVLTLHDGDPSGSLLGQRLKRSDAAAA